MDTCERCSAVHKLVQQDAQRPYIQRVVMILVLYHLWSHVLQGAAERVPLLHMVRLHTPPEIADFYDVAVFDQDILRLDVPMDKALLM